MSSSYNCHTSQSPFDTCWYPPNWTFAIVCPHHVSCSETVCLYGITSGMRETSHFDGVMITNIHQGIFKKRGLPIVRESGSEPGNFCLSKPGLRETFAYGICNPGPYFGIQLKESRISRTIGIHNPSSTVEDWYPVPGIRNPRLGIQNPRFHYMGRRGAHVLAGLAFANGTGKRCKS